MDVYVILSNVPFGHLAWFVGFRFENLLASAVSVEDEMSLILNHF